MHLGIGHGCEFFSLFFSFFLSLSLSLSLPLSLLSILSLSFFFSSSLFSLHRSICIYVCSLPFFPLSLLHARREHALNINFISEEMVLLAPIKLIFFFPYALKWEVHTNKRNDIHTPSHSVLLSFTKYQSLSLYIKPLFINKHLSSKERLPTILCQLGPRALRLRAAMT